MSRDRGRDYMSLYDYYINNQSDEYERKNSKSNL